MARTLYAMGLALRTERGQVYTTEQLQSFLERAGFAAIEFKPIPVVPFTMGMIIAKKN